MRTSVVALLLALVLVAGCTSLGFGNRHLQVEEGALSPFELKVRFVNPADHAVTLEPEDFRLVGADGAVFPGWPSGREGALGAGPVGPGESVVGWVGFNVGALAVAPLTLVVETDGVREETGAPGGQQAE